MSEWTKMTIGNCLEGQWPGEWGTDPVHGMPSAIVYRSTELDDSGHLEEDGGVLRSIPTSKLSAKALKPDDILLEASGGSPTRPVGRVALFVGTRQTPAVCANFLRTLRPSSSVSAPFLRWLLMDLHQGSGIWRYQQQTTGMINLKVADYLHHEVALPPLPQQRRIATILTTLDEVIEATEKLVEKHQQIKAGLMHDLFTRGLWTRPELARGDHKGLPCEATAQEGQLRPPPEEAPGLYQDSPLGLIPKAWKVALLDSLAKRGSGHTPNRHTPSFWDGGIKWVSLADSSRLDQLYISETEKEISALGIENSSAVLQPAGIVVLSRDAGVGKSAITTCPMAVSQHFMCWICGPDLDNHFLYYWLQDKKREFENIATGSTIPTIGLGFFRKYKIAVPTDGAEQQSIRSSLLSLDETIFALQHDLAKLRQQKHGLMHDLLTGRVRTTRI